MGLQRGIKQGRGAFVVAMRSAFRLGHDAVDASQFVEVRSFDALRIKATDLHELGCIDGIVPEPEGGAHSNHEGAAALLDSTLQAHLSELKRLSVAELVGSDRKSVV